MTAETLSVSRMDAFAEIEERSGASWTVQIQCRRAASAKSTCLRGESREAALDGCAVTQIVT